jgi:hypothetical protein
MAMNIVCSGDIAVRFPAETCRTPDGADGPVLGNSLVPIVPDGEAGGWADYRRNPPGEQGDRFFGLDPERIVPQVDALSGAAEWYLRTREGLIGPCATRADADALLMRLKAQWHNFEKAGRRHR